MPNNGLTARDVQALYDNFFDRLDIHNQKVYDAVSELKSSREEYIKLSQQLKNERPWWLRLLIKGMLTFGLIIIFAFLTKILPCGLNIKYDKFELKTSSCESSLQKSD